MDAPIALMNRCVRPCLTLTYEPLTTFGFTAEWRIDGCGKPMWFSLASLEDWLDRHWSHRDDMLVPTEIVQHRLFEEAA